MILLLLYMKKITELSPRSSSHNLRGNDILSLNKPGTTSVDFGLWTSDYGIELDIDQDIVTKNH